MAKSRVRKAAAKKQQRKDRVEKRDGKQQSTKLASNGRDWVPWVFVPVGLFGVLWMVVWSLAGPSIGFMMALGNWNLLIAIGSILVSFGLMTLWK